MGIRLSVLLLRILFAAPVLLCFSDLKAQSKIWGSTYGGFKSGIGGIFSISADGKFYEAHHHYGENPGSRPGYCDLLHASNGKIYGTTTLGGTFDLGVIFQFDTSGNQYKMLYAFDRTSGALPYGGLIQARNGKFYGMTSEGGKYNQGVLYSFQTDSGTYRVLHHFKDTASGGTPYGELIQASNGLLYGMCSRGGVYNKGVVFSYHIDKNQFVRRFSFNDTLGAEPMGSLTQAGNRLYGVTRIGGTNTGKGAIFSIDTSTYKVTRHYSFGGQNGENPMGRLVMANNGRLYGVTVTGGITPGLYPGTAGVVFAIDTSTHNVSIIRQFSGIASLTNPVASLVKIRSGKLFGVCTYHINSPNKGGIFSIRPTSNYQAEKSFVNDEPSGVTSPLSVLTPRKLIGLGQYGGVYINRGVIYTYDTATKAVNNLIELSTAYGGSNCNGSLLQAANGLLYGTTFEGGKDKMGILFSINPKTSERKILHDFSYTAGKGMKPRTTLIQTSNGKIWGVTTRGGSNDAGTLFSFDTANNTVNWEYEFQGGTGGRIPQGNLVTDGSGILYGTTFQGGANSTGLLYSWNPSTKTFTVLADFSDTLSGNYPSGYLTMTASGNILGTAWQGGKNYSGTVFSFNPRDSTLKIAANLSDTLTGSSPRGGLTRTSNGLYYGLAEYGGANNYGAIFSYNDTNGKARLVYSFQDTFSGRYPKGNLTLFSTGLLYGMATSGGKYGYGTVFKFQTDSGRCTKILNFNGHNGAYPSYGSLTEVFTEPNRWTGKKDSLWSETENWSQKRLPSEVMASVIPGKLSRYPLVNGDFYANNLTLDSTAQIRIGNGHSLKVNGRLTLHGTLHVLAGGSLLPGSGYAQTGTGIYRIYRKNGWKDSSDYALWSSPVTVTRAYSLPGKAHTKRSFLSGGSSRYHTTSLNSGDTLKLTSGYLAGGDTMQQVILSGIANNGTLLMPVKKDTGLNVFNLLGNPYPGTINALKLIEKNTAVLDRVIYVKLQSTDSSKYCTDDLVAINEAGSSGGGVKSNTFALNTTEIGASAGFFTVALKTDTVRFDNTLRNGETPVIPAAPGDLKKLTLSLTDPDKYYSRTLLGFSTSASGQFDAGLDAYSLRLNSGVHLYTLYNQRPMAIQCLNPVDSSRSVSVGMFSTKKGKHVFRLTEDTPFDYHHIYLVDKDSSKVYDLRKGPVTVYLDSAVRYAHRFSLRLDRNLPVIKTVRNRVCKGDTAVFTVENPDSRYRYQWIFEGKAHPSDTLTQYRTMVGGKLVLKQTYRDLNSDETAALPVIVYSWPAKPVLKRKETEITAGKGYASYKWYVDDALLKDSVRHAIMISRRGSYYCTVSDTNHCSNRSDTLRMNRVEMEITLNHVCKGEKAVVVVKNPESGFRYQWMIDGKVSQADTNQTLYLYNDAQIRLIAGHKGGYTDTSEQDTISFKSLPSKPVLSSRVGLLDAGTGYASYQWYRNGISMSGKNTGVLYYSGSGTYYCMVKNTEGCENRSDTADIKKAVVVTLVNNPCQGDTAKFAIKEPKAGFRYKWQLNATTLKSDTGLSYATIRDGVLMLVEWNPFGYADTAANVTVTVRPRPATPGINLSSARLNTAPGLAEYRWIQNNSLLPGDTLPYLNLSDTGNFRCVVRNALGCEQISAVFQVTGGRIRIFRNSVCEGDTAVFGVLNPKDGFRYQWIFNSVPKNGDTGLLFTSPVKGTVRLLEWNTYGYRDTSSRVAVVVHPIPMAPLLKLENTYLDAGAGYDTLQWFRNQSPVAGADQPKLGISQTGKYHCVVTNKEGCQAVSNEISVSPASVRVIANPVCNGDSARFQIINPKKGFEYRWFRNDSLLQAANDSQWFSAVSGLLRLEERNSYGYFELSDTHRIVVKPVPVPPTLVFRKGVMDAGADFEPYIWYKNGTELTGESQRNYIPTGPGNYTVLVGLNGCFTPAGPVILGKISIEARSTGICPGDSATLQVQQADTQFQFRWLKDKEPVQDAVFSSHITDRPGRYQAIQWNTSGYADTSEALDIVRLPEPLKPKLLRVQQVLDAGGTYNRYQWYKNQLKLSGDTGKTLTLTETGLYYCAVWNAENCTQFSDTLNIENLSVRRIPNAGNIVIRPNPTSSESYIQVSGTGIKLLVLTDMQGKVIRNVQGMFREWEPIGLQNLPAGAYMVSIKTENGVSHFRVIRQ